MSDYEMFAMCLLVPMVGVAALFVVVGSTSMILLWMGMTPVSLGWFIVACFGNVSVVASFGFAFRRLNTDGR